MRYRLIWLHARSSAGGTWRYLIVEDDGDARVLRVVRESIDWYHSAVDPSRAQVTWANMLKDSERVATQYDCTWHAPPSEAGGR
jgi:hypothetical protein